MKLFSSVEISSPPKLVFPWIGNPSRAKEWQTNVKQERILEDKPGMIGTRFVETVQEDGNELQMTGVVTQYEPSRLIAFHLSSRVHELDVNYSLEALGENTRVTLEALVRWKFPMNVVSLFAGMRLQRRMAGQASSELLELKRLCERGRNETDASV